jgi:hypothetical protein
MQAVTHLISPLARANHLVTEKNKIDESQMNDKLLIYED